MKTMFPRLTAWGILAGLLVPAPVRAQGASDPSEPPPGSLILRGSKPAVTPEQAFGLSLEQADLTDRYSVISQVFDPEAFCRRFVPTLPVSDTVKDGYYLLTRTNDTWRRQVLKESVVDALGARLRFLGTRLFGTDTELLFRGEGPPDTRGLYYVGYVTRRHVDGMVRVIDVHRFWTGELLSQTVRRRTVLELSRRGGRGGAPLTARDEALLADHKAATQFESRCENGPYSQIKEAYAALPLELQNEQVVLHLFATAREQSLGDILVPIERWRRVYPDDPCPNLALVNFYWKQYHRPPPAAAGPAWTAEQERAVLDAVERANAWFADPMMEIQLAQIYGPKQAAKARRQLEQALKRTPLEPSAFTELLKLDLATDNFPGVADTLHRQEVAMQTNLTAMVNASREYAEFRNSFSWKKWQHDYHSADPKKLLNAPAN